MTIEIALLVAGGVLVSTLSWRLHRLMRRLSEIQGEVNALRDIVSRVFLTQLNHKTENKPSNLGAAPFPLPSDAIAKSEMREYDAPQPEIEAAEIDELCAKLITLVPPKEAAPLLPPDRASPGARERRLIPRHQTSRIGKIMLDHGRPGGRCTVSNMSPAGALLLVANARGLPEQFDLYVDTHSRRCIARWRRPDRIGVRFKSIPAG